MIGPLDGFKEIIHVKVHIQHQELWSEMKHGRPLHAHLLDSAQRKKNKTKQKLCIPGHGAINFMIVNHQGLWFILFSVLDLQNHMPCVR